MKIPNVVHFIFGLHSDFGGKPFSFIHYLAVRSAHVINRPDDIFLYYKYEPSGEWWQACKKMVTPVQVDPPAEIFGNPLVHFAHRSDVLRLEILLNSGGIYLDIDTLCLKPFIPLLDYDFVMGKEENFGLCNAVILSRPGSEFLKLWYQTYRSFRSKGVDDYWSEHSVAIPGQLAAVHPPLIHVEEQTSFFQPYYNHPEQLWGECVADFSRSYCVHLWEQVWWDVYLRDLKPENITHEKTNFAKLCGQFVK